MDVLPWYLLSGVLASLALTLVVRRRRKRRIVRKYWVRPWLRRRNSPGTQNILHLYKELVVDGDEQELRATLWMDHEVYRTLLQILTPALKKQHTNFRQPIGPEARLALTLRYLAMGECFRALSQSFRIGLSTIRLIVRETCKAIAAVLQDRYLRTPQTKEAWLQVAGDFEKKWNLPHCIGAIDGKHVRIIAPRNSGTFYHNYKDFFSVVMMAIVNANYEFLYLDVGAEGKASDGGIFSHFTFSEHLHDKNNPLNIPEPCPFPGVEEDIPFYLVGDDAFRLGVNMMKPYPGIGLTRRQQIFNYRLSRSRQIVENVFGIVTSRFQIFKRSIEVHPDFVVDIIWACCILHNYLRINPSQQYIPNAAVDQELPDGDLLPGPWRQEVPLPSLVKDTQKNPSQYAKNIRNILSAYFITKEGEIPWQYKKGVL